MSLLPFYRKSPFFRLLIFYVAGLIVAGHVDLPTGLATLLAFVVLVVSVVMALVILWRQVRFSRSLAGVLLFAVLFSEGLIHKSLEAQEQREVLLRFERKGIFEAVVLDAPEIRSRTVRTMARITGEMKGDSLMERNLKAVLYIERDAVSELLMPGSGLIFLGDMRRIWQAGNPDEFDYRKYLASRKVYLQAYLDRENYHLVQADRASILRIRAANIRQVLLSRYKNLDLNATESGVLSALTLGYRNDLYAQTESTFVHAGVMHIMALSGFHVGMVALLLSLVMQPFKGTKAGKCIRLGLTLSALWLFSLISGLSVSVIRATLMFSLALPGRLFGRKVNVYNVLFASTLLMLTNRPGTLHDTGFQLSFLAVAGISMAQPLLQKPLKRGFLLWETFRKILVVSFAAQLATLPVTLLTFHQFPTYFWLSNLFVIPVAALIIYSGLLYLAFCFIGPLAFLAGKVVVLSVKGLLLGVTWVEKLPGSLQEGIAINSCQAWLLLSAFLFLGLFVLHRKGRLFVMALTASLAFLLAGTWRGFHQDRQRILSVNNISDVTCIHLISGRDCLLLLHPDSMASQAQLKYSFGNYWANRGVYNNVNVSDYEDIVQVSDSDTLWQVINGNDPDLVGIRHNDVASFPGLYWRRHILGDNLFLQFYDKRMLVLKDIIEKDFSGKEVPDADLMNSTVSEVDPMKLEVLDVDIVVVTHDLSLDLDDLDRILQHVCFDVLVLDSSVGYYDALGWNGHCRVAGVKCWNVAEQGAFILKPGLEKGRF